MVGDEVFRRCVSALWTLIGSLREPTDEHVDAALSAALDAIHTARGDDNYLLLHEVGGALHVSGRMLRIGVDVFAAANGLATLFRDQGVGEVLFDEDADREALEAWARSQAGNVRDPAHADLAYVGIHTSRRVVDEAMVPLRRSAPVEEPPDSRLRSTFLQHHLIAAFGSSSSVPPHLARVVIGAVVDRMLGLASGMEPLTLLQRDPALLHRSLHVAVLAVVFARVLGWPEARLADLGGAALLHDVGRALDAAHPGPAGFGWLLERGGEEFWLRSAIVARSWRFEHGQQLSDLGSDGSLLAAIVRLAVTVAEHQLAADAPSQEIQQVLHAASERGEFPRELVVVAVRTLGHWTAVA